MISDIFELERLSASGDSVSQLCLAMLVERDIAKSTYSAIDLCRRAAESGLPLALYMLGIHLQTLGPERWPEAAGLLESAAAKGVAAAADSLAAMYSVGFGGEASEDKMLYWLNRAIDLGDQRALGALGAYYLKIDDKLNTNIAVDLLRRGVSLGDDDCKAVLGKYLLDSGVPEHITEGFVLIREAAEAGISIALLKMSEIYRNGLFGKSVDLKLSREYDHLYISSLRKSAGVS